MDFGLMFFASAAAPSIGGTYHLLTEAAQSGVFPHVQHVLETFEVSDPS